jgi:hypothetical protein
MTEAELTERLVEIRARGRDILRKYLTEDQHDRDAFRLRLYRDDREIAEPLSELLEVLSVDAAARASATRLLGDMAASDG